MTSQLKKPDPFSWLAEHWPKSTIFLAVYTFGILYLYLYKQNFALFLLWLQTLIYWLHQFEEYVYPGEFTKFANRKFLNSDHDDWPLTKTTSFWINIPIIFVAFPVSAVLAGIFGLSWGIWTAYFSILNALSHIRMFLRFGYNPGFFVSLFLNIPAAIFTIYFFYINSLIPISAQITGLFVALAVLGALMVWGRGLTRNLVKRKN